MTLIVIGIYLLCIAGTMRLQKKIKFMEVENVDLY